jgi:sulfite reductase (NADPH) flavoprotein alpha-component
VWLTFNPRLKGRAFLWHLHAVLGTWVLIGFLLMSLTGLYWSYNWYRDGLYAIAGVERPAGREQGNRAPDGRRGERSRDSERARDRDAEPMQPAALDAAWTNFNAALGATELKTATLTFEPGRPIEIRYLHADSRHDRANSVAQFDANTGAALTHERYEDKRTGEKFMASIFPLHSGSFFGLPGTVLYMLASLGMPVFAVTGWMMYLDRRRKKRAATLREGTSAAAEA